MLSKLLKDTRMHKSKLAGFIIDCQTDDVLSAAKFWSAALGMKAQHDPAVDGDKYVPLNDATGQLHIEVQAVDHPSRVHLDIETDDVNAEVKRLEALGAKRVQQVRSFWVMEAPTGQRFCVVRPTSQHFDQQANVWSDYHE
jgi:predicted enzyme related to lactoylglutathione lyase